MSPPVRSVMIEISSQITNHDLIIQFKTNWRKYRYYNGDYDGDGDVLSKNCGMHVKNYEAINNSSCSVQIISL